MRFSLLAIGLLTACSQGQIKTPVGDSGTAETESDTDTDVDADTDTDTDADTDTDTDDGDHIWSAGPFQFATVGVEDRCLDGTASTLLMPDGSTQPWANPIDLPGWGALSVPQSVSVPLPSPLADMSLTLTRDDEVGTVWVTDGDQASVLFDEESYMDCEIDFNVNAILYIVNNDSLNGTATLSVTTATGGFCPRINTPCDVLVHFEATRL
jgi:hypothetical protein